MTERIMTDRIIVDEKIYDLASRFETNAYKGYRAGWPLSVAKSTLAWAEFFYYHSVIG